MVHHDISAPFKEASVLFPELELQASARDWYPPPAWNGVFLKDLVTAKDTGGAFSYHLVSVQPQCEVADHDHDTQWEWNVVLGGTGSFLIGGEGIPVEVAKRSSHLPGIITRSAPETRSSPSSRSSFRRSYRGPFPVAGTRLPDTGGCPLPFSRVLWPADGRIEEPQRTPHRIGMR